MLKDNGTLALLRVTLETGRKHQIRVHLAERGTAIVGDAMYGQPDTTAGRLMLAAVKIAFVHPRTGKQVALELKRPKSFVV